MNQKWTKSQLPSEPLKKTTKTHQRIRKIPHLDHTNCGSFMTAKKTELPFQNYVTKLFLETLETTAVVFQSTILNDAPFVCKATSGLIFILVFVIYESHTKIQKGTYLVLSKYCTRSLHLQATM